MYVNESIHAKELVSCHKEASLLTQHVVPEQQQQQHVW